MRSNYRLSFTHTPLFLLSCFKNTNYDNNLDFSFLNFTHTHIPSRMKNQPAVCKHNIHFVAQTAHFPADGAVKPTG